ncbi:MAG: hypothetical protein SF052_14130 [Bacteroidia bacterium]|nr:hypothetical protein [Bacteroidia bacterium]
MSYKIRLSTEQTYILSEKMQQAASKKQSRRLFAISLRHFGYKIKDISLLTGASEKTVTTWIRLFLAGGFDALLEMNYARDRDSRLRPYKEDIRQFRQTHPKATIEDLQQWLKESFNLKIEYSWLYRYVENHGL